MSESVNEFHPYDWRQEKEPELFAFELPHSKELEYDPYNKEVVLGPLRSVIEEARIEVGFEVWKSSEGKGFVESEVPTLSVDAKLLFGAMSLYEQSTDENDDIKTFGENLASKHGIVDYRLSKDMQERWQTRCAMESASAKVIDALEAQIQGDADKSYIAAKILASHPGDVIDDYGHVLAQDFAIIGAEFDSNGIGELLVEDIDNGVFDSHIARDMLYKNRREVHEGKPSAVTSGVAKFIDMTKYLLGTDNDHEAIYALTTQEGMSKWHPDIKKQFDQAKQDMAQSIVKRHEVRRDYSYSIGVLLKPIKESEFASLCRKNPRAQLGRIRADGVQTRLEEIQSSVQRKRPKSAKKVGLVARRAAEANEEESKTDPKERNLQFVDIAGNTFSEDSKEFKKMIGDYVSAHPEDIDSFKQDIKKSLDYLRDPVKTNGYARGIQPLKTRNAVFTMADGKKKRIQRFRPSLGTGVSLSCKLSHTTRILFVEHEGAINIMGIADKDDIYKLLQKFGVNSKDRRG